MAGKGRLTPADLRAAVAAELPQGPLAVALSGGADSSFLAWAVSTRSEVRAITVDHGLPASKALAATAKAVAQNVGIGHSVVVVEPRSETETDLRSVRLSALELSVDAGEWILTAHTRDDQAETVLGNLLRGAGPGGIAGIPARRGRFVRPMLGLERSAVRAAAIELGLPFLDDPANTDLSVRRNRLRLETLPGLRDAYNPRLEDALQRAASIASADDAVLEARAERIPLERDEEAVLIPAAALETLPTAVAARIVRRAVRMVAGPHSGTADTIAGIFEAIGGAKSLPEGLTAMREGPWVALVATPAPTPGPVSLNPAGTTRFGPWVIETGGAGEPVPFNGPGLVRPATPGDRIAIRSGSKPVGEALREAGVPIRLRGRWPVVEDRGRIVWLVGVRVAHADAGAKYITMSATRERM